MIECQLNWRKPSCRLEWIRNLPRLNLLRSLSLVCVRCIFLMIVMSLYLILNFKFFQFQLILIFLVIPQIINEKPQIIQEYESGKAIPNQQIIGKLERALGAKLRGKKWGGSFRNIKNRTQRSSSVFSPKTWWCKWMFSTVVMPRM